MSCRNEKLLFAVNTAPLALSKIPEINTGFLCVEVCKEALFVLTDLTDYIMDIFIFILIEIAHIKCVASCRRYEGGWAALLVQLVPLYAFVKNVFIDL